MANFSMNAILKIIELGLIISSELGVDKDEESCAGRCGAALDSSRSCQCNSPCVNFGDCCADYNSVCGGGSVVNPSGGNCDALNVVSEALWNADVNRFSSSEYTVNYQSQVSDGTTTDASSAKLFTSVDESKFSLPTYKAYLALTDNYDPDKGDAETLTAAEQTENDAFLDAILETEVMDVLLKFLVCKGYVSDKAGLRSKLNQVWLDFYPRSGSSSTPDTSGFEHVMVGEYKSGTAVNGFHNWIAFYEREKAGELNYYGYVNRAQPDLIGAAFRWNNRMKALGSFFIGVSPEFDIALYTLCFMTHPGGACHFTLNGSSLMIQSYNKDGHLATAFASA